MTDLRDRIAHLSPEKRKLLELLLKAQGVEVPHSRITPQPRTTNRLPLSFAQQRLWFLDQFQPNSPFYNIPSAMRLTGQLHVAALERCVAEIVRRHETLRTTFAPGDAESQEQPVQVVAPVATPSAVILPVIDLQHVPQAEREAEVRRLAAVEAQRPFDLQAGPLLRVTLLKLAAEEHIALFTLHHIVSDGWSMGVLVREVAALYRAFAAGDPNPLPPLPIQYADYALWQRQHLQGEVLEQQLAYWQRQLGGDLPVLELPTDRPRPAVQTYNGATYGFSIPQVVAERLKNLSQQEGATLFMALLAAFNVLLHRYSGQADLCIGTPVAGRSRAETEGLIGCFINTLVLRTSLAENPGFRTLLAQVREVAVGAFDHQDVPFETLVEVLEPERDMSHSALFQVMFILQNAPISKHELPNLTIQPVEAQSGTATFDLTLGVVDSSGDLLASFEYNTDLFDAGTIARMAEHFNVLLAGIVANPDQPIAALPLMRPAEQRQIVRDWNDTAAAYPVDECVQQLFELQAARTPDAVAVVWGDTQLSYDELNTRANYLAHHLQRLGVGPETLVGICLERSLDLPVAVLGVLKAGGAYVPLDPNYPADRLQFMLQDAQMSVLLTQERLLVKLLAHQAQAVCLDSDWERITQGDASNPVSSATPDNLAYVIFTSGSTGQAKGVLVEQRSLVNAYRAWEQAYELRSLRAHLQMANFAFDVFTGDFVRALCSGATLVLCPSELLLSPPQLYALLQRTQVDAAEFVPVVLRALMQHLDQTGQRLDFMRLLVCGSDSWYVEEYVRFRELCGSHTRLINSFGLTEATIDSCYFEAAALDLLDGQLVPVGRPFPNMQLYILDQHRQPVPVGVPGELYVGGAGVARGYLHRPELTAERFVSVVDAGSLAMNDGIADQPPSSVVRRLYKTGDLARYRPDGTIEFLGRADQQVKIRGFRIEPGEVEAALGAHPGVQSAVVLARKNPRGETCLVGYALPAESAPTSSELRRFLQERLPEYMVPSALMLLPALPLTPNGKIDRKLLPAPDWSERLLEDAYVAPRTPVEELVANSWQQVLGVAQVGAYDNFFALGGHSLLATQVVSRVRDAFGIELPLRTIFEAPTVAALAERIGQMQPTATLDAAPIVPVPRDGALPLSFAQQRFWFFDQFEPGSPLYNIPDAVRLVGTLNVEALHQSFNTIVRRHEILRTTFPTVDGQPRQQIAPELAVPLPIIDLTHLPLAEREADVQRRARIEAMRGFDLQRGPLVRATLLRLGATEHVALLTMHHIVADGWSTGVLIRELAALYTALAHGQPTPLPALPIQYADYAAWQRQHLQGAIRDAQLNYWIEHLRGAPPLLELPTDRPRPAVQTNQGGHHRFTLPPALLDDLHALSRQEGATLFMTLLAAWQTLLARYSGQTDISVGTPIANRTQGATEALIGCFINTLALRTDLSGDPPFRALLGRVRETALGAYAHQDLPFEMIVDALQPARNLSYPPLFQVMFILQNAPIGPLELPGLTISPVEAESAVAPFDLTLTLAEAPDGLYGDVEYNTDLFERATIERMARHFARLLAGIVADPDQPIMRLPLLTEAERRQLLVTWNTTDQPLPRAQCIHHLIEQQVARTPAAIAVSYEHERLSYAELNARANQLAQYLQTLGVGPETQVGLCLERSLDLMVALLGVLKAGAAYVPLDPAYPAERLQFMLQDANVAVLLTRTTADRQPAGRAWSAFHGSAAVVDLVRDWPQIAQQPVVNPNLNVTGDNLAYVIYTSGSTGTPKGVLVEHRAVVNHNLAMIAAFGLTARDRVLQFATINFDAAVEEIFPTWIAGATLVLRPAGSLLSGAELQQLIEREHLTVLDLPTAYWHELVYEWALLKVAPPAALRLVVVGGEAAMPERLQTWRQIAPDVRWINTYGPTETTVVATLYEATGEHAVNTAIPIGQPLPNVRAYVLDAYRQPVPIGVPGELYVGGLGVARGYHNRPELTAEKFVRDPFVAADSASVAQPRWSNLYKTGDRVRRLPDGNLVFLGRVDQQIKLRGFRVEPGEIEARLIQHPGIRDAAVVVRVDELGHQRLVAYVVADRDHGLAIEQPVNASQLLRDWLKERLPEYMIPAAFVMLHTLPLTPSGKVDRTALPAPASAQIDPTHDVEGSAVAPRTPAEATLAAIWQQVLGLQQVGVEDNFFELGGDSILSIQVIARANQAGLHLTPRQFFERPTIAGLAAVATAGHQVHAEQGIVTGDVPLTPIQRWFVAQRFAMPQHWNQALLLEVAQPLDRARLEGAVAGVLQHHDALRLCLTRTVGDWRQLLGAPEATVPVTWIDLAYEPEATLAAAIEAAAAETQRSLDLAHGPLLRVAYFDLGAARGGRLLIVAHHLVIDGVSWRILLEDIQAAYTQLGAATTIQFPPKTTSFQYWATRLVEYAQSAAVQNERPYWLAQTDAARLPVDVYGGANTEASAQSVTVALTALETEALLRDVPPTYGTEINEALLTALALAYGEWTGSATLLVELEGHGREDLFADVDLSRTIGWFTSIYPLRLDLRATDPGTALKSIKEQARQVPNRGIGYGLLRYLNADGVTSERLAALSPAEISFNYLGQFDNSFHANSVFRPAWEGRGPDRDSQAQRSHLIDITASIVGGALQIEWTYSTAAHQRATIARLAEQFLTALRTIITHCQNPNAGGYTPSDFALADLDQRQLDKVLAKLSKPKGKRGR